MSPPIIGIIGTAIMLILMLSRVPIYAAMAVAGFLGFVYMDSLGVALYILAKDTYTLCCSYSLSVIPLFILMGNILFVSGVSRRLYYSAYKWIGHLRGGLAMTTIGACTAFGAICGSQIATSVTIGAVAIPEMRRYKYDVGLATGCVAAGGLLGGFIPPSISFIVYGIMTAESIGRLFVAGIFPGLLIAAFWMVTIFIIVRRNPSLAPAGARATWRERLIGLSGLWETVVLFLLVIGGLFAGAFTPTEAGAVGAGGALIIGLAKRQLTWQKFTDALFTTLRTAAMVILILVGATIFGHFLVVAQIPSMAAEWVSGLPLPTAGIMLVLMVLFLFIGCWMETLPVMLLAIPIMVPVCHTLDISLIWFGVFLVVSLSIGMITPPVGINVYATKGVVPDVPLETIFQGVTPFTLAITAATVVLIFFPQISLFLPNLMYAH